MKCILVNVLGGIALSGSLIWALLDAVALGAASEPPSFTVVDEQGTEHKISAADLAKLPRTKAKVTDRENQQAEYEGVQVSELLQAQGVVLGKELRGPRIASYLLFEADDGYRAVLAIAEVDPATTEKVVLLADRKNGDGSTRQRRPVSTGHPRREATRALDQNAQTDCDQVGRPRRPADVEPC